MPRLLQLFKDHNPATLKIIADYWGIVDPEISPELVEKEVLNNITVKESQKEIIEALSVSVRSAWEYLISVGGKESWAKFSRQYGEIRPMGASRIEREQPQIHPQNPAETLWYRGMLGRMFFDQKPEPQEVAYIPDEFLIKNLSKSGDLKITLKTINDKEIKRCPSFALDTLNDLTTILAAARAGEEIQINSFLFHQENHIYLVRILIEYGLLTSDGEIVTGKVKSWFEQKPGEMLASIVDVWYSSREFNELRLIPEIICEGSWKNDPKSTRIFIWNILKMCAEMNWVPVNDLVNYILETHPDFQRPAGNYDLWMIRDVKSNEYLHGFESWSLIEKRLLLSVITKIMPALGLLDLGMNATTQEMVFRWSSWGKNYLEGVVEDITISIPRNTIRSQGSMRLAASTAFPLRYQLSRFCQWISLSQGIFEFHINLKGLIAAKKNGMEMRHTHSVLSQLFEKTVPPTLINAITDLDKNGCLFAAEKVSVLRAKNHQWLEEINRTQAARFLGEQLNPTTIVIKPGMEKDLERAILESGFFLDFHLEE